MPSRNSRQIALQTLLRSQETQRAVERILARQFQSAALSSADTGLCRELVSGCVRWRRLLDWLIERATEGREQKPAVREILRLGLYQIFFLSRIPEHAIVDESVRLAKTERCLGQAGFINAMMRRFLRERGQITRDIANLQEDRPALGQSHPDWLFKKWEQRWGCEKTVRLMEWNNRPAPTCARVNPLLTDPGSLAKRWEDEGVEATPIYCDWAKPDSLFRLRQHPPLESLGSFRDGLFYVQDPSTLLAVDLLNPQPGQAVLDLCAAPGGKTCQIAGRMNNEGQLSAIDISESRIELMRENCERMRVTCATLGQADAAATCKYDRVLVDVPCSNTGVMRRRLDLRWRLSSDETRVLADEQLKLLAQAAEWTKPDGQLVYSTCSIEPEENEQLIARFLDANLDWQLINERTLHPVEDHTDGAYAAQLTQQTGV
ncbi:MAG: 16S rRNA (cytosine(967)-C(5))-methyltransferase RsmB [Verrucomicrobiota bacterium]|jgi:16S rRNA (cytosine967-C5)-methyltransferase|nr:16S rRNA (cytosine(967)-C(5))-methyltransferase RsmB [Verrucomicrobiota bacterium]